MERVCVIGLGYIGLPTALVLAEHGHDVIGFDIDERRVESINRGDPVIVEPEIVDRLRTALTVHNFHATTTIQPARYFIIAVPTPFLEDKNADLSYVMNAADSIARVLKQGDTVIVESTVPVGTSDRVTRLLEEKTGMKEGDFFIAHCPERVLPGKIFYELIHNARIIGGMSPASVEQAGALYRSFVKGSLYLTDAATAEMVKLIENSSRDVAIAFANQVAAMAYSLGLNPYEVIELANKHPRVNILTPRCGVGGHCIAVDPWFLIESFPAHTDLLKTARIINDEKPNQVLGMIRRSLSNMNNPTILVLGLTYKPDVDDLRESPALHIAQALKAWKGINLLVCEPLIVSEVLHTAFAPSQVVTLEQGFEQADVIVCLVAHSAFNVLRDIDLSSTKVFDFCGLLHRSHQESAHKELLFWPASNAQEWPSSVVQKQRVADQVQP